MKIYRHRKDGDDYIPKAEEADRPQPGHGEVLVKMRAHSLNYRDHMVRLGQYGGNDPEGAVPLSDGAGEVAAVGDGVEGFAEGDRVVACFFADWAEGPPTPKALGSAYGGGGDSGLLAEYVAVPAGALTPIPDSLSFAEAATLPCAAVTAWHGLQACQVTAGSRVLLLGTGGVSMFALQIAKAMGAEVCITSSSDDKLAMAKSDHSADHGVNYKTHDDWPAKVREAFGGQGADAVIEVGGPGTFDKSVQALRVGGHLAMIGVLTEGDSHARLLVQKAVTAHGILVGSTAMLRDVARVIDLHGIKPVIDSSYAFDDAAQALVDFAEKDHVGKIVIEH